MNVPVGLVLEGIANDELGRNVDMDVHRCPHVMASLDEHEVRYPLRGPGQGLRDYWSCANGGSRRVFLAI